ncbi:MAG: EamA family transporter [Candidatus Levyibacteriota bacterium]
MNGLVFAFLALCTSVVGFLLAKSVLKTKSIFDPIAYAANSFMLGGIFATVFYFVTSFHLQDFQNLFHGNMLLFLLLDVLAWAIGSLLFYPSFKHIPLSETTIIGSFQGFFVFLFGSFLFKTELLNLTRISGGLLILFAIIFLYYKKGSFTFNKYSALFFFAIAIFGLAATLDSVIVVHKFFTIFFLLIFNFGLTGLTVLLLHLKSVPKLKELYLYKKTRVIVILNSSLTFISFVFIYNAYKLHVAASQVNMILSSQTILVVLFASIVFKEKNNVWKKIIAGMIAGIGVYLLS